jgi:hypothetical protein
MQITLGFTGNLIGDLQALAEEIPKRIAFANKVAAKTGALYVAEEAPVRTGALAASVYYITADGENDYNERSSAAMGLGLTQKDILPPIPQPSEGALIGVAARYARPVNDGYGHPRNRSVEIGANPFFHRGLARIRAEYQQILLEALEGRLEDRS